MTNDPQTNHNLEAAYQRAARFQNAVNDMSTIAKNTTLIPHWIGESDCFWYRRGTQTGVEFRLVNAKDSSNQQAFDHQVLAAALAEATQQEINADNLPITQVKISLSPAHVQFAAFDQYYCFDTQTGQCLALEPALEPHSLVRLVSPDGIKVAFARDYNLWIQDIETGEERALTTDGEELYFYATQPVTWGFGGPALQARWSPDSQTLFTTQTDNRQVKRTPVIDYIPKDGSVRPIGAEYPCAYPGDDHVEEQRILAINVETGRQCNANYQRIPVNRSAYGLFNDNLGWWSSDSRRAYFVDLERGDQVARVVEFDTSTGATRILFEETSTTFLNLSPSEITAATLLPLPETHELIWFSERNSWAHLYLYDLETGKLKQPVTQGDWMVREILHFDPERRELFFQAGGRVANRDPYYLDICRVNIDTGEITALTDSDHEYTVTSDLGFRTGISIFCVSADPDSPGTVSGVSPDANYIVATRSRTDQAPVNLLLDRNGTVLLVLEEADTAEWLDQWQWPEPVQLVAADGETPIYGAMFRPSDFSAEKKYPVIDISITSGELAGVSKGSFTNAPAGGAWDLQAAALAELGFIVVTIDGRGTPYRKRSFVDCCYGRILSYNKAEDRIAGLKQLSKKYPYMDLSRVGVIGFNGLGSAVYSLLEHPEFYKVGVSHALQDARTQSITVGEVYEGMNPARDNQHYADQLVNNLRGNLLLMHGTPDRMDHSVATWRLVDALQKANKDFEMLILPNEGPLESGAHIGSNYAFRRTWDYFVKHLQGD